MKAELSYLAYTAMLTAALSSQVSRAPAQRAPSSGALKPDRAARLASGSTPV